MKKRNNIFFLGTLLVVALAQIGAKGENIKYQKWATFRNQIKKSDSVKRYYTFENLKDSNSPVKNIVGDDVLRYIDFFQWKGEPLAEELNIIDGRFSVKKAVRLNQCSYRGTPFNPSAEGFTVECWIKINGQGTILDKSGKKSGSVIAVGNGWNDGWRITYGKSKINFSMGHKSSRTILSASIPKGVWFFLAVSWDGKKIMKLYVNGRLVSTGEFTNYINPKRKRMIIGYDKGHGLGSLRLDVDELIIYNKALSAHTIKKHSKLEAK
jgi:concanavalin A-like lectin/glucanase superfamily protein